MNGIKGHIHLNFGVHSPSRSGILQNLFESLSTGFVCDGFICGVSLQKLKSKLNWQNCELMAFPSFCWDMCLLSYCLH